MGPNPLLRGPDVPAPAPTGPSSSQPDLDDLWEQAQHEALFDGDDEDDPFGFGGGMDEIPDYYDPPPLPRPSPSPPVTCEGH